MEVKPVTWGKGMNKDVLPSELPDGFCSDAINARFSDGFAKRAGGVLDATTTYLASIGTTPEYMDLYTNASSATGRYLIYAGVGKIYADNLAKTKIEITRLTDGIAIASITFVGTTATATTATAHGRSTGNNVTVYGALPSDYNATGNITVTGATTFTYVMATTPATNATTVGAFYYNVVQDFTGTARDWSGGFLNGVCIFNNATNGLYYWNGDVTMRMRRFPASNICDAARPFKNYIVMMASTVDGVKQRHNVAWSAAAEPGTIPSSFTATELNDAGDVDLAETGGSVIDCMQWGDANIVYKEDGRFGMQYIGGNDVFRFYRLPGSEGLINKGCIANTPKGQVFVTANWDVMIHTGGEARSIAQGRVRSVLSTISPNYKSTVFVAINPYANEVWIVFPSGSSTAIPDTALVWNWDEDTWGNKTLAGMKCATSGLITPALGSQYMMLGGLFTTAKIGLVELSEFDFGSGFQSTVERSGITFGDRDSVKFLQRTRWDFDGVAGTLATVYHGSAMTADGVPTYATPFSYYIGTSNFASQRAAGGRYLSVKTTLGYQVLGSVITLTKLRSSDIEYSKGGRR